MQTYLFLLGMCVFFSMYFIELCVKVEILRYIQNQNTTIAEKKVIAKNIAEDLWITAFF